MNREEYLMEHHHITESMIGLISMQNTVEDVQKVLSVWKPKLKEIQKKRYLELCKDLPEEEIQKMLEITGLDK
jgi:hypothetical protein